MVIKGLFRQIFLFDSRNNYANYNKKNTNNFFFAWFILEKNIRKYQNPQKAC
jgi:hypothetical protein